MNKILIAIILLLSILIGCKKDSSTDNVSSASNKDVIVYIANNEIYKMYSDTVLSIQLTNDGRSKKEIAINKDKNKIAYLDQDGIPEIIDTQGNFVDKLSNYKGATCLRWAKNENTLYFIYNNKITFYGTALPIPNTSPIISGTFASIDISSNNDLAFVINSGSYSYLGYILNDTYKTSKYTYSYSDFENVKWSIDNLYLYYYDTYYDELMYSSISYLYNEYTELSSSSSQYAFSKNEDFILYCYDKSYYGYYELFMYDIGYSYGGYNNKLDGGNQNISNLIYVDM